MVIKITPQQAKRVNALLRKLCANYDGGNCLLLDDGEPCVCVQSISKYGLYCNYFKNAVLPTPARSHRTQTPESTPALYSMPVPTIGDSVRSSGTA